MTYAFDIDCTNHDKKSKAHDNFGQLQLTNVLPFQPVLEVAERTYR
jgi:hypothetical protein